MAVRGKLNILKTPTPKKGTLEYLFKDYSGESFKTTLVFQEYSLTEILENIEGDPDFSVNREALKDKPREVNL